MTTTTAPRQFIGLFTEEGLDQICETTATASREKRDLRAMGCTVCTYEAADESALWAIDERMREGLTFARARTLVEAATGRPDGTLSAARNPDAPQRPRRADRAAEGQGGAFPMWALTAERTARAIDDSLTLDSDLADPFAPGWCDTDREFFGPDGSGFWG